MSWNIRKSTAAAVASYLLAGLVLVALGNVVGCSTPTGKSGKGSVPGVIPKAPDGASVVGAHMNREGVQFHAAERINVLVTGTAEEAPVKEQTAAIVDANKVASAAQIEDLTKAYAVTIDAQAREIDRLAKQNGGLVKENTGLVKTNSELQAKLDDFGRKVAVYTANGLGALLLLCAVAAGILTKNLTYVGWCVAGSALGFGTARVVGHWLFPWIIGVGAVVIIAGGVVAFLVERKKAADKARLLAASDDIIAAVEEIRGFLKSPPVEIVESIRYADTPEKALAALRGVGDRVKTILSAWVSEADGTAAVVDARRRALHLI